ENLGFAGGNNIGIRYALKCGADYIWLLNNDAVVEKDTLESSILLAERLKAERQEKVGLISSKIYCYKDRAKVQYNGGKPFYKGIPDKEGELPRSVEFAPCCSLLINRKLLEEIGLLNEDYFLYYEDTEFCIRTLKAGWTIWYNPYSKVYHKGGASIGLWLQSPLSAYYATRNILLCQFQVNPSKVVEIFAYLKNSYWSEIKKAPECIFGFVEGIKDFIKGRKGEKDLRPKKIEACLKKVKDTPFQTSGGLEERLETSGNLLILNPEKKEVLEQFVNIAQSLFFRNYARLSMGNKNI
ncbi:MAG: glycosyltransferase family 2 protein, partial [Deltaproteobacteria bacterium]|nr:glycosyltransferase family 2 protein [Deltaproteobacteria bacterium]